MKVISVCVRDSLDEEQWQFKRVISCRILIPPNYAMKEIPLSSYEVQICFLVQFVEFKSPLVCLQQMAPLTHKQ